MTYTIRPDGIVTTDDAHEAAKIAEKLSVDWAQITAQKNDLEIDNKTLRPLAQRASLYEEALQKIFERTKSLIEDSLSGDFAREIMRLAANALSHPNSDT